MHSFYARALSALGAWGVSTSRGLLCFRAEQLRENLVLFSGPTAVIPSIRVQMSLCCYSHDTLMGRYWGSHRKKSRILQFEVCIRPHEWGDPAGASFFRSRLRAAATSGRRGLFWPSPGLPCTAGVTPV